MTNHIARVIIASAEATDEEKRMARLWLRQRELFPGSGRLTREETDPALVDRPMRLTVPIGELLGVRVA